MRARPPGVGGSIVAMNPTKPRWAILGVATVVAGGAFALVVTRGGAPAAARDARAPEPIAPVPTEMASARPAPDDAGPPKAAFMVDADTDGGLSPACMALLAASRAAHAAAKTGACPAHEVDLDCATTTAGVTWGFDVVSVAIDDQNASAPGTDGWSDMQCETHASIRLVRVDANGAKTFAAAEPVDTAWYSQRALSVRALADYDHDGEVEVLYELSGHDHEGGPVGSRRVLAFDGRAIGPYTPAARFDVARAEDVDGDGLPDLVTRGPYARVESSDVFGNAWPAAPAMFVAHAKGDGSFALGDATAVAWTRAKCPSRPALSFAHEDLVFPHGAEEAIVCARLRGASAAEVGRAWDAACPPTDGGQLGLDCEDWAKDLAAVAPPFALK